MIKGQNVKKILYRSEFSNYAERFFPTQAAYLSNTIITVPHDGVFSWDDHREFMPRTKNDGIIGADAYTWIIARDIMEVIPAIGIRGLFKRKLIDYNRPTQRDDRGQIAYVDDRLKLFYETYHNYIFKSLEFINTHKLYKAPLLIDLHGFTKQPNYPKPHQSRYDVILGTNYRSTVQHNSDILLGEFLLSKGYAVFVPDSKKVRSRAPDKYAGQFTVQYYAKNFGVEAIQIEIAKHFRRKNSVVIGKQLAVDLAEGIHSINEYLRA